MARLIQKAAMSSVLLSGAILAGVALFGTDGPTASTGVRDYGGLIGYRAVYDLELESSHYSVSLASATGLMVSEWGAAGCDGFTFNQRIANVFHLEDGGQSVTDGQFATYEARDRSSFRFVYVQRINGREHLAYRGSVDVSAGHAARRVIYEQPEGRSVRLPEAAIFPTEASLDILEAARAGEQIATRVIFDGSEDGATYLFSAVIGGEVDAPVSSVPGGEALEGVRSWWVSASYFKQEDRGETPEYSVRMRLYDNGVVDELRMDYGDFIMVGGLRELQVTPLPDCG
jgi:hypothetical protein